MSVIIDGTSGVSTPNTFGFKNLLINGSFFINQRAYVSAATLASGAFGHDRWKAGASGGDYSFTQGTANTTITIASGKSLIQVVENVNVNGTSFVLSWTGTAQARYAVNSATPSGSYAASPITITGQTAGSTMSVEFNAGTLTTPQLELGAQATSFDFRGYGHELILCQRYCQVINALTSSYKNYISGTGIGNTGFSALYPFAVVMRTSPTGSISNSTSVQYYNGSFNATTLAISSYEVNSLSQPIGVYFSCGIDTSGVIRIINTTSSATCVATFSAEL